MGLTGLKAFMLMRGEGESGRELAAQELMPHELVGLPELPVLRTRLGSGSSSF